MLRLATRRSPLARWQAAEVARLLRAAHPGLEVELVLISTEGDQRQDVSIRELSGQGVFVKEVQAAVLDGRADLAVHSAKDLPSTQPPGLTLSAFPRRADPRDVLVGARLRDLAIGATVATGSVRRRAQMASLRPDLIFVSLRGNIATRLTRVPAGGAVVMARAALDRLGWSDRVAETLDPQEMLPQVGQGAIAIECRSDDRAAQQLLAAINDRGTELTVKGERAFLAQLGSGCDLPVGALASLRPIDIPGSSDPGILEVEGMIAALNGEVVVRGRRAGHPDAGEELGRELATWLLEEGGGRELLAAGGRTPPPES